MVFFTTAIYINFTTQEKMPESGWELEVGDLLCGVNVEFSVLCEAELPEWLPLCITLKP